MRKSNSRFIDYVADALSNRASADFLHLFSATGPSFVENKLFENFSCFFILSMLKIEGNHTILRISVYLEYVNIFC